MSDVFDEDLIKELGLDPEDLNGPKPELKKKPLKPDVAKPQRETAPREQNVSAERGGNEQNDPMPRPQVKKPAAQQDAQPQKPVAPKHEVVEPQVELNRVSEDIPVHLAAVLAKKTLKLKNVLEFKPGEILDFKKLPQDPIDLVANGKLIAKAELVLIDDKVGARIIKLIK